MAEAGVLELERRRRGVELQVRRAVEPGADVLHVLLEVPVRERHGAILWHRAGRSRRAASYQTDDVPPAWRLEAECLDGMVARDRRARAARLRGGLAAPAGSRHAGDGVRRARLLVGLRARRDRPAEPSGTVRTLAEATLALVLFGDASRIDLASCAATTPCRLRLLGIGLPLTSSPARSSPRRSSASCPSRRRCPRRGAGADRRGARSGGRHRAARAPRIRQGLNVESGLNDGICVPLLFIAVALADVESEIADGRSAATCWSRRSGTGSSGASPAASSSR